MAGFCDCQKPAPASELGLEQQRQPLHGLFLQGAVGPFLIGDLPGALEVVLEHPGLPRGEDLVVDVEVGLVVEAEGAVVEVGRADRDQQLVHDHDLAVVHGGLVLMDLRAGLQQRAPTAAGGRTHGVGVDDFSGRDDADLHAAFECIGQGPGGELVGDKVGARQVNAASGRRDGQLVHQLHAFAAARGGAGKHLGVAVADCRQGREVGLAVHHLARDFQPVVHENSLHLGDGRALDLEMGVAPVVGILAGACPLGRNAHTAGEAGFAVNDQQLAVGAVVHARQVVPVRLVELADLHAGRFHFLQKRVIDLGAAHPVQQHMHLDAGPGAFRQCIGKLAPDIARPVDVGFKGDAALRAPDGLQHGGEDLVPVEQLPGPVAAHQGRAEQGAHGAPELGVLCGVQARQLAVDLFFPGAEIQYEQHAGHGDQEGEQNGQHRAGLFHDGSENGLAGQGVPVSLASIGKSLSRRPVHR